MSQSNSLNLRDANVATANQTVHGNVNNTFQSQLTEEERNRQCLLALKCVDPREVKTRIGMDKDDLLPELCNWVFEDAAFLLWWNGKGGHPLLWISGNPGKGKTMIAMAAMLEIENKLEASKRTYRCPATTYSASRKRLRDTPSTISPTGIMAFFMCQNTDSNLNKATSVLRGLIFHLVAQQEDLIRYVRKAYERSGSASFEGQSALPLLWNLLVDILNDAGLHTIYLLVDALDECVEQLNELLILIRRSLPVLQKKVRWLMTSRNEPIIQEEIQSSGISLRISLEDNSKTMVQTVEAYIDNRLAALTRSKQYDTETRDYVRDQLALKNEGTFLWVALVCKELMKLPSSSEVRACLSRMPSGLQPLYTRMMEQIEQNRAPGFSDQCKRILAFVTLAYRPASLHELGYLSGLPQDISEKPQWVRDRVMLCGSFLNVQDDMVTLFHQSAKDFFAAGNGASTISQLLTKQKHCEIFRNSLILLSQVLKADICSLKHPGACIKQSSSSIERTFPKQIRYASCYWIDHLCAVGVNESVPDAQLSEKLNDFLRGHLLHWVEAMAVLGQLPSGIGMMRRLERWLAKTKYEDLYALVHDAIRTILQCRSAIEEAPLQIYSSALIFAPENGLVRQIFAHARPAWISTPPRVQQNWNALQQILEGHTGSVRSVVFSPDGKQLASASNDMTVRLWDADTGTLQQTLEGHTDRVNSVTFSPDGKRLASASSDTTVRLWDADTGTLQQTLEGHIGRVNSVTFSPDGKRLASASIDRIIQLWDADTGTLQQTLEGHTAMVYTVTFSPDGKRLASASYDNTVRLWDADTGTLQQILPRNSESGLKFEFDDDLHSDIGLSKDSCWLTWEAKPVIWLPRQYRPTGFFTKGNAFAAGCASGEVYIIKFNPQAFPT